MRPILISDLTVAARALLVVAPSERMELVARMLKFADFGDRYTRRFDKPHPDFGDGTISSVARKGCLPSEPTLDSQAYCACLELVLQGLIAWRRSRRASDSSRHGEN